MKRWTAPLHVYFPPLPAVIPWKLRLTFIPANPTKTKSAFAGPHGNGRLRVKSKGP